MTTGRKGSWIQKAARAGYAAKGMIYALIGVLAIASVVSGWGSTGGSRNAVETIDAQPYGAALLGLIAFGLFAYATWQAFRAIVDPEQVAAEDYGAIKRFGYGISALLHAALGVTSLQLALGGSGGGSAKETILSLLLGADTFGEILVTAGGFAVVGFGLYEARKGLTRDFEGSLRRSLSSGLRRWVVRWGMAGLVARGLVFTLIGGSLVQAGLSGNASQYEGLGEVLRDLAQQPLGMALLVTTAFGLALYGGYQLALVKFRRVPAAS